MFPFPSYTPLNEGMHPGEFLVSEANGQRSRANGVLAGGQASVTQAGTILGLITEESDVETIAISGSPNGGTFGYTLGIQTANIPYNATPAAAQALIAALPNVGAGNVLVTGTAGASYVVTYVNALADTEETGSVSGAGLTGGTNAAATLAHTTIGGSNRYNPVSFAATDGSQTAAGLLWASTDSTAIDRRIVLIDNDAEVNANEITYPTGVTSQQIATINAQLLSRGIKVRQAV